MIELSKDFPLTDYPIHSQFIKECFEVTEGYEKIRGRWKLHDQLFHVVSEIVELDKVLRNKDNEYGETGSSEWLANFYDEIADVFLTTMATVNFLGVKDVDLNVAILGKLQTVKKRLEDEMAKANV